MFFGLDVPGFLELSLFFFVLSCFCYFLFIYCALIIIKTQSKGEHRSFGQSMTNFWVFSCGSQNIFTGCHSFFDVRCKKINQVVALH